MEEQVPPVTSEKNSPRKPWLAFLLSLIIPGLGQAYTGQMKKAFLFFALLFIFPPLFGMTRASTFFYGFLALAIIVITIRLYAAIEAALMAKRQRNYVMEPYNSWYFLLFLGLAMFTTVIFYASMSTPILGIQSFTVPTTSNNPTVKEDDFVVADMRAYTNKEPDYGDIVVYKGDDNEMYICRVVGLPGDRLEVLNFLVSVNGASPVSRLTGDTSLYERPVNEFEVELPNGHKHLIYIHQQLYDTTNADIRNIQVPAGSYYLMGDFRTNSLDSRYKGPIGRDKIAGRLVYSYAGASWDRVNVDFRDK